MKKIKKFIDSKICLVCKGCCRFKTRAWVPNLLPSERESLRIDKINVTRKGGIFFCQFLEQVTNHCRIYGQHLFECRLYPFLVVRHKGNLVLAAHLACPYVRETLHSKRFDNYAQYLIKKFNSPAFTNTIKKGYMIFSSYPAS